MRRDSARAAEKPAMPMGKIAASEEPASIRSASPRRMWSAAFWMQKLPDAQAEEML